MAGTGHKYEVSNPSKVAEYVRDLRAMARERELDMAEAWLGSKHFIKYITSERFTFRLKLAHVTNSVIPDEKRTHILSKLLAGEEVRRFDVELFETLGPDIPHILDWVADLKASNNPTYRKIARMETPVLVAKADAWTKSLYSKRQLCDGELQTVLSITNELEWLELRDIRALRWEGDMMSHCVGSDSYADSVAQGNARIFSLRKDVYKPILTLEVRFQGEGFSLVQVQKSANGGLPVAYCDAAVALLNAIGARDGNNVARRYALCFEHGTWTTVFDAWNAAEIHGRRVLTDGRSLLFMCATDSAKPLVVMDYALAAQTPEKWYETEFSPEYVRLKPADDGQPHYLDQLECCAIANNIYKGNAEWHTASRLYWMALKDGTFVPYVDTLKRFEMADGFYYGKSDRHGHLLECWLPHSSDPARIIMTARQKNHLMNAHVNSGQRITPAETPRVLAFLTATKTHRVDRDADEPGRTVTSEFLRDCQPKRIPGLDEWRSFAADMVETPSKATSGKWQEAKYLLRYLPGSLSVDIYLNDCVVSQVSGSLVDRKDLMEIARKLRERRIMSDRYLQLGLFGNKDKVSAVFMRNGKWTWADEKNFVSRVKETLEAVEKNPHCVGGSVLSGFLGHIAYLAKKDNIRNRDVLTDLKSRLLVAWFLNTPSFTGHPFGRLRFLPSLGGQAEYPIIERLIDLADLGFTIDTRNAKSQFRKFLSALSDAYGKGKVAFHGEQEYFDLLVRWHKHVPKKFLNKIASTWINSSALSDPQFGPARILEILDNHDTRGTRFREAVYCLAERLVADAEYVDSDPDVLARFAKLFLVIVRSRYMYGRYVEALARLVRQLELTEAGDPAVRSELETHLTKLEEREARFTPKAA
ncbi:hypothetical protein GOB57_24770 [Sinorhizobium meliloti]|nr:hypothetical protein [Sinorhizobium meliloti]